MITPILLDLDRFFKDLVKKPSSIALHKLLACHALIAQAQIVLPSRLLFERCYQVGYFLRLFWPKVCSFLKRDKIWSAKLALLVARCLLLAQYVNNSLWHRGYSHSVYHTVRSLPLILTRNTSLFELHAKLKHAAKEVTRTKTRRKRSHKNQSTRQSKSPI